MVRASHICNEKVTAVTVACRHDNGLMLNDPFYRGRELQWIYRHNLKLSIRPLSSHSSRSFRVLSQKGEITRD